MNNIDHRSLFEFTDDLLPEEANTLREYKIAANGSAYQLNAVLRGRKFMSQPDPTSYRRLDSAISKCRLRQPVRLFRATFAEDFDPFVRNGVFHDPAYASTSLFETNIGGHFVSESSRNPIKLVISCPPGANGLYLELPNDSSETESECLLPRCGRYRIDVERTPITGAREIAAAINQTHYYHAKDFNSLRIIELTLLT